MIAETTGARHAVATVNGSAALHAALLACGVRPGDEVLVPSFTFVATANAVTYCGATPHFVDCETGSLGINPHRLEKISRSYARRRRRTVGQPQHRCACSRDGPGPLLRPPGRHGRSSVARSRLRPGCRGKTPQNLSARASVCGTPDCSDAPVSCRSTATRPSRPAAAAQSSPMTICWRASSGT